METRLGNQRIYHNFAMGTAKHPEDGEAMFIVFTDRDNEITHMFEMPLKAADEYADMVRQSKHNHKLHIAGAHEMPR